MAVAWVFSPHMYNHAVVMLLEPLLWPQLVLATCIWLLSVIPILFSVLDFPASLAAQTSNNVQICLSGNFNFQNAREEKKVLPTPEDCFLLTSEGRQILNKS